MQRRETGRSVNKDGGSNDKRLAAVECALQISSYSGITLARAHPWPIHDGWMVVKRVSAILHKHPPAILVHHSFHSTYPSRYTLLLFPSFHRAISLHDISLNSQLKRYMHVDTTHHVARV